MPSTSSARNRALRRAVLACVGVVVCGPTGCAHIANHWAEDGPSAGARLDSPSTADARESYAPAPQRQRDWPQRSVSAVSGAVAHGALYFEDPFEDKGHGRADFAVGWEDYVAMPYGFWRYVLNGTALPVSLVVTPPFVALESDGVLSRQLLGYDHDAAVKPPPPPSASDDSGAPSGDGAGSPETAE